MLKDEILKLLRTDKAFREEVRRQLLTDELLALLQRFDRLIELVGQLGEAERRQSEQIQALVQTQQRTEEALQRQSEQIQALVQTQRRTEEALQDPITWQQGEDGRRRGERYEREIIKSAPALFNGGRGGPPDQPWVQQRLTEQLKPLLKEDMIEPDANPLLADLIWWKGERVAVVEISYLINGYDVERAARRAETIRRTGAEVVAIVIGKDWATATEEIPGQALSRHVEWYVGTSLSEGFIDFRRAPSS